MSSELRDILYRAEAGPLSDEDARLLAERSDPSVQVEDGWLGALCEAASARRVRAFGRRLTFSPKVFLPLTNLCRNYCDYCSFRRSPGEAGEWTMLPAQLEEWLERGRAAGAIEALFCLGDRPETLFPSYRSLLQSRGHADTVDFLAAASARALAHGLLPHTNAGVLSRAELARLRPLNASMGLMLESVSERLSEPGMAHARAPDKRPAARLRMLRAAGELAIPFTTGILLGIGESPAERLESLLAIRALHARYGHIQEVIVQSFRRGPCSAPRAEPSERELAWAIALARSILPDEVSVQAPPNLTPGATALLVGAGIDDFGGISAVTPDYINPGHAWPELAALAQQCAQLGFSLAPRLPLSARFARDARFVAAELHLPIALAQARLAPAGRACPREQNAELRA
jgi:FO synthase